MPRPALPSRILRLTCPWSQSGINSAARSVPCPCSLVIVFCGYVAEQSIAPIRSTPGVISLVRFGMEIAVVQPAVVERVRRVEAALQANAAAGALKPGDKVKVIDGPFVGLEGLASRVSAERIDVLMTIMGQPQRIRFSPGHLARPV